MDKQDVKNLKKRYLIWLYKTTKDAFDRYERRFTQMDIDKELLCEVEKELKTAYMPEDKKELEKFVNDFMNYIDEKEKQCLDLKYKGKKINPEFLFLDVKLQATERIIINELGKKALEEIKELYEQEMINRIIKSTEHK
ncbi:MAG: hypothetical protein ABH882_07635 [Candidatus Omnitrophota bacterium]|nr:hypothetical protein [Candidatus Omnitrophota bacterium]MBU1928677.1 hypothetical protein [Candidatus Omnitrophota bacterium]MBU2035758.1 hypothetical protein [Candidatus Omnitrophota bacterium]MBU2222317.1 hypothetical protein [Candidatus Omnitrophota bacterium]MBU2258523.1 hypothetical protein [Candidatus Omnitrophota bacterium]